MSRETKLIKNTFILAVGSILPKFGQIITLPILTGYLSLKEYGTLDLVLVLVALVLPIFTLQIQTAAFRFLIDRIDNPREQSKLITNIFVFSLSVSLAVLLVLFFLLPSASSNTKLLVCSYLLADLLTKTTRQIARGLSKNSAYSMSAMLSTVFKLFFTVLFVGCWKLGIDGALLAYVLGSSISFFVLFIHLKLWKHIQIQLLSSKNLKELINYSWPMVPASFSMWIMQLSNRFVITFFLGVSTNAIYAVACKIPSLLTMLQNTFTLAWQENASLALKDKDASEYYSRMYNTMFNIMAGLLGLIIAATPVLFFLLIRGDYKDAYVQIPILVLAMFFYCMADFVGGIFIAYKQTKIVGFTTAIAAVINIVIDVTLIRYAGLFAASVSTLVSYVFLYLIRVYKIKEFSDIKINYRHSLFVLLLLVMECIIGMIRSIVFEVLNALFSVGIFYFLNKTTLHILIDRCCAKMKH